MKNVHGRFAAAADFEGFVDRFFQAVPFVSHMRVIAAAIAAGDFGQVRRSLRSGHRRRADKSSAVETPIAPACIASATSAVHLPKFIGAGPTVDVAQDDQANLRMADRLGDVERKPLLIDAAKILGHRSPASARASSSVQRRALTPSPALIVVIPCVSRFRPLAGIVEHRRRRLAHHVDEAGSNHQTRGIDHPLATGGVDTADFGDFAPRIPMSATYQGTPLPSTIRPPLIRTS